MISLSSYISSLDAIFPELADLAPWIATSQAPSLLEKKLVSLGSDYKVFNNVAIHQSVRIDSNAILKGPAIISPNCFVGAHCYIRGGVFLGEGVSLGPGCEVKSSFIFPYTALGHFNFVGDSILGAHVNMEAGSVIANHYNERKDKTIFVVIDGIRQSSGLNKFGALVGDHTKIGANAVLSPGTILAPDTIVKRLELIEQCPG
jgi:NDP-sugar pyrophosphorylase family protein